VRKGLKYLFEVTVKELASCLKITIHSGVKATAKLAPYLEPVLGS
jgi:hypothetical protein